MMRIVLALIFMICFGCNSPRYLSKPKDFKDHVKGLHMKCRIPGGAEILGEIIEVSDRHIMLLSVKGDRKLYTMPKANLHKAEIIVAATSNNPSGIGLWAGMINLLSISHGYAAAFSLPINLITTISIANDAAYSTFSIMYPDYIKWDDMKKFARFPQGLPAHIPKDQIR